jgi:5'-nucleotidase / UDP-sugar diphosphatase
VFRIVTILFLSVVVPLRAATTITLLHFSDYHSHAQPFYSEGSMKGGVARAIGFLERHKRDGALVFIGGDMMNKGAPAWSDKYHCAEWAWFNGVVDAMAFGNHDADYGNDELTRCRSTVRYPILSANTTGFERYRVFERKGVRIGVFAIAGADFPALVTNAKLTFTDPVAAARDVVQTLRESEHVDAVVMIGHEHAVVDEKLAAAVPGIDLIFGSHTHLKRELTLIPGTRTWFISPFQYGTYVSVVEMTFDHRKLTGVHGRLVPIDESVAPDRKVLQNVASMERDLESDPKYHDLFAIVATLRAPIEVDALAKFTVDTMRDVTHADVALSTASSFRQALPSGAIDLETLRAAMPYDNEIVVAQLTGDQLQAILTRANTTDPASDARSFSTAASPIDRAKTYAVAVTDYMANVSPSFRDVFRDAKLISTGFHVRAEVLKHLMMSRAAKP